ncbi:glycosyltransferase [Klenkia brasiliensis]|uniref:4,4'-diaponeurosporenoate glycosyltransferase n=1 Tax=Klenkia brasiliensis TaxID=333142 RepID=A0A1G7VA13_9ACTN|nr:glycosyltransferase family 2 protein [Klenkia brasiliensis]SDG56567.1 Glycosyl transferase family 2 [Klenkia brasiliensis]
MSGPDLLGVVVPARDEAALLPGCLAALRRAAAHPDLAGVPVLLVVATDRCTDATPDLARAGGAVVVDSRGDTVGDARHAGALRVLAEAAHRGVPPRRVWLAATDADSRVRGDWLALHRAAAESGVDAVLGLVRVADWAGHPPHVAAAFTRAYDAWRAGGPGALHPHVHGANLGVRGDAYLAVGGFPPLAVSEDAALAGALALAGRVLLRTPLSPVTTSARRHPRAPGGFGADLDRLADG